MAFTHGSTSTGTACTSAYSAVRARGGRSFTTTCKRPRRWASTPTGWATTRSGAAPAGWRWPRWRSRPGPSAWARWSTASIFVARSSSPVPPRTWIAGAGRLAETIQVVRRLWDSTPFTFAGTHHRVADANVLPGPAQQPRVPILIAGGGERATLRLVAQYADTSNFGPSRWTGSAYNANDVRRKCAAVRGLSTALRAAQRALQRGPQAAESERRSSSTHRLVGRCGRRGSLRARPAAPDYWPGYDGLGWTISRDTCRRS